MKNFCEQSIEILQKTRDGDDLDPRDLKLVEIAVNGWLSEAGEVAFAELYKRVQDGYTKPWLHGIEHLTRDHSGYVYWKGVLVEHYSFGDDVDAERESATRLAAACRAVEERDGKVTASAVLDYLVPGTSDRDVAGVIEAKGLNAAR